jgi:hypothetical protein
VTLHRTQWKLVFWLEACRDNSQLLCSRASLLRREKTWVISDGITVSLVGLETHHSRRTATFFNVHFSGAGYPLFATCTARLVIPLAASASFSMNLIAPALVPPRRPPVITSESFILGKAARLKWCLNHVKMKPYLIVNTFPLFSRWLT